MTVLNHKLTNSSRGEVYDIIEDTVMIDYGGPFVTINQKDPLENKDTVFESIHIPKYSIIRMAVHLLLEGASIDLSYKELHDTINELQRRLKIS